jgi:hypothetical protein
MTAPIVHVAMADNTNASPIFERSFRNSKMAPAIGGPNKARLITEKRSELLRKTVMLRCLYRLLRLKETGDCGKYA